MLACSGYGHTSTTCPQKEVQKPAANTQVKGKPQYVVQQPQQALQQYPAITNGGKGDQKGKGQTKGKGKGDFKGKAKQQQLAQNIAGAFAQNGAAAW
jgi:hypothetical protein